MANKLSKVTMAFGGATSPTAVTSQHIESLLKVIADTNVENHFSGHISLATGSISALKEYTLGSAGITYHGSVTPIAYSISASSTTVEEGSRVTFNVNSEETLPLGAFRFVVKSVAVTSGSITSDEVKALCRFTNNVLSVDVSGKNERWQATITVESSLVFDPNNRHTASVTAKGLMLATDFTVTGDSAVSIINGTPVTKNYTFSWIPTGGDAPSDIQVTCDSDNVTIGAIQKTGFQVVFNGTESYTATINVTTLGKTKEIPIVVTHKRVPTISIIGADTFIAKNGVGSEEYSFGFNPSDYDVEVELLSVATNNSAVVVSNKTFAGFKLSVSAITADAAATVTATFRIDGEVKTFAKNITAIYKQVFNEFKVYKDSAWVVPNSNIEVKVGNVVASYIGDGLWMVDEALVDESMNVTAGGVVLGKYGKQEYADGSELFKQSLVSCLRNVLTSNNGGNIYAVESDRFYPRLAATDDINNGVYYIANQDIYFEGLPSYSSALAGYGTNGGYNGVGTNIAIYDDNKVKLDGPAQYIPYLVSSYTLKKGYIIQFIKTGSKSGLRGGVMSDMQKGYSFNTRYNRLNQDLSLPLTSFIATNGTLNTEITPITPNGGNIVVTSVTSSNITINASVVNGKINLTGTIAEDSSQTSKLTIGYTINGYSKSVEVEITVTYEEAEVPPPPYDVETLDTLGAAIMDVDGNLYASASEWTASGKTPTDVMGVAISDNQNRFCVYPYRKSMENLGVRASQILPFAVEVGDETSAKQTYFSSYIDRISEERRVIPQQFRQFNNGTKTNIGTLYQAWRCRNGTSAYRLLTIIGTWNYQDTLLYTISAHDNKLYGLNSVDSIFNNNIEEYQTLFLVCEL